MDPRTVCTRGLVTVTSPPARGSTLLRLLPSLPPVSRSQLELRAWSGVRGEGWGRVGVGWGWVGVGGGG